MLDASSAWWRRRSTAVPRPTVEHLSALKICGCFHESVRALRVSADLVSCRCWTWSRRSWAGGIPTVGQAAERSRTIGPDDIDTFAAISGDRNPLHYDAEFAASTKLGGIVVQSGLITAIINGAAAEGVPGPGSVFMNTNLDFKAPVRPDDTITGASRSSRSARTSRS
jgi:acyl dehydratase